MPPLRSRTSSGWWSVTVDRRADRRRAADAHARAVCSRFWCRCCSALPPCCSRSAPRISEWLRTSARARGKGASRPWAPPALPCCSRCRSMAAISAPASACCCWRRCRSRPAATTASANATKNILIRHQHARGGGVSRRLQARCSWPATLAMSPAPCSAALLGAQVARIVSPRRCGSLVVVARRAADGRLCVAILVLSRCACRKSPFVPAKAGTQRFGQRTGPPLSRGRAEFGSMLMLQCSRLRAAPA